MLKSVFLDDKEHAHLIKFIQNYRDEHGNNNISSAIRYLMQKGYEHLKSPISLNNTDMKKEILNDVLLEVNNRLLDKLLASNMSQQVPVFFNSAMMQTVPSVSFEQQNTINPAPKQEKSNSIVFKPEEIVHEKPKSIGKKPSTNTLLNNLLSNASR